MILIIDTDLEKWVRNVNVKRAERQQGKLSGKLIVLESCGFGEQDMSDVSSSS